MATADDPLRIYPELFRGLLDMSPADRDAILVHLLRWRLGEDSPRPGGMAGFAVDCIQAANRRADSYAAAGRVRSERKAAAAKANGRAGGRPHNEKPNDGTEQKPSKNPTTEPNKNQTKTEQEPNDGTEQKPNKNRTVCMSACMAESSNTTPQTPSKGESGVDGLFENFWRMYPSTCPRKVDKKKALARWRIIFKTAKNNDALYREIVEGLQRWIACDEWQRDHGRYIKAPVVWLNGDCWKDNPGPSASAEADADAAEIKRKLEMEEFWADLRRKEAAL